MKNNNIYNTIKYKYIIYIKNKMCPNYLKTQLKMNFNYKSIIKLQINNKETKIKNK